MVFAGLIFTMQIFILMAALPVAVMSMQTSRRHRSQQRNFMLIAIMLAVLAFVGMVLTIALVPRSREVEYLLALCLPSATILLSVPPLAVADSAMIEHPPGDRAPARTKMSPFVCRWSAEPPRA